MRKKVTKRQKEKGGLRKADGENKKRYKRRKGKRR